ncbi:MAG: hypothetical protein JO010_08135, partial [Alphaproteobacteria bacterium]|nr:hypothetical protein [Alphaproteobacteria bacterium]
AKIYNSLGFQGGLLSQERRQAERFYKGEAFGNEIDGRSQVVSRDVAEAVDSMMPSLMRIFSSGDQVVRFNPSKPGAEAMADQATDYVNWIWAQQNEGFQVFHAWFKDALLKKTGIIKIWWDASEDATRESYEGLTDAELEALRLDPGITITQHQEYPDPSAAAPSPPQADGAGAAPAAAPAPPVGLVPPALPDAVGAAGPGVAPPGAPNGRVPGAERQPPAPALHDVVVRRTVRDGRIRVRPVPPEEFLIDRRAVDLDEVPFLAHRVKRTLSELIEEGYPRAKLADLEDDEIADFSLERLERFADEDELPWRETNALDPAMREVWITECYIRVDYDGDGIAELRRVTVAGEGAAVILDNAPVDDHPFAALTPIPMPHKFFGMSIADQTMDLQLIKSTLWRGALDALYLSNAPQMGAVEGKVNLDDLLNRRPGAIVRIKDPAALVPIQTAPLGSDVFTMIEYIDTVREQRTGVTRYNQGLDPDTLNKTASGINAIQNAAQQRLELIARIFAETGVKRAFRRILELVAKHQQKPQIIRLRERWVAMDPREWTDEMDMTVSVGLGTGNRDQQVGQMMNLLQLDQQIVQLQGGVEGPLVTVQNIYNKLAKLIEAAGLKSVGSFYTDPRSLPPKPPGPPAPPDPALLQQQAALRTEQQRVAQQPQIEAMNARIKAEAEVKKAQIAAATQLEIARLRAGLDHRARLRGQDIAAIQGAAGEGGPQA